MKKLLACALLLLPACVIRVGGDWGSHHHMSTTIDGHEIEVDDEVIYMDGIALRHSRWVSTSHAAAPGDALAVATASGPIELHGVQGAGSFSVLMWSEYEGDGHPAVENGKLVAHGEHGAAFIDAVSGNMPAGVALRASSGTGDIVLHDFAGAPELVADNGTGDIRLDNCSATSLRANNGTGDVRVAGGRSEQLHVKSGTGDITCNGLASGRVDLGSGTGDLSVVGCEIQRLQANSGTGDASIRGGAIKELHHELGTGDLDWR